MTTHDDLQRPSPSPDDAGADEEGLAFVAKLAANYSPAPMSDTARADFDRSLAARLASPQPAWRSAPVLVSAAAAFALAVIAAPAFFVDVGAPAGESRAEAVAAAKWESQLFYANGFEDSDAFGDTDDLPADYAAIAGLLLGG